MIRRPPRSTLSSSSAASDVYKRQAGRIPTDKGYRFYVDTLMDVKKLRSSEMGLINKSLETNLNETDELLKMASNLLSSITHQIACVTYPKLDSGIFEKIQIIQLTSTRILVVITIKSGLVKTITLELNSDLKPSQLDPVQQLLNERLSGLSLKEIRETFKERFRDVEDCLLYTSDAADEEDSVDLGGRRII